MGGKKATCGAVFVFFVVFFQEVLFLMIYHEFCRLHRLTKIGSLIACSCSNLQNVLFNHAKEVAVCIDISSLPHSLSKGLR